MLKKVQRAYGGALAGVSLIALWPAGALAQTAPATPEAASQLDEIVVTAQKRSQSVQDIALAVTALGGETLENRGAATVAALAQQVPGLNVSEQIGQARVTLRGIGVDNISTGAESSVAFNQDGVFYSRSAAALAAFYDVSRVEVLRGPQGTLYGRNATGGSVNIITNRPQAAFSAGATLTVGNRGTLSTDGFVTGALSPVVSGRLSFQTQKHDGYGTNLVTGTGIDTKDSQAIRGQLLFQPNDRLDVLIAADYYTSDDRSNAYHYFGSAGQTASGEPIIPTGILLGGFAAPDPRDIATARDPSAQAEFYGFRLDATYALSDSLTLRSLSAYRRSEYSLQTDISPISVELFPIFLSEESDQFSQEFQLNWDTDRNKMVAGLYYLDETIDGAEVAPFNLRAVGGPDRLVQGFYAGGRLETQAVAAYAQDSYSITDRFRLTVGARYSWEKKAVDDQSEFDLARPFSFSNPPVSPRHIDDVEFQAFTPKLGLDFDLTPESLLYVSYSRGFKSGTYNLGNASPPLDPEKVDAYEGGLKTTVFDGRLRANLAGFLYDYTDLQVGKVQNLQLILENAATARIYGIEGEFTARPLVGDSFQLTLNAAWLHARFREYVTGDQARPGGDGVTIDPDSGLPAFDLEGRTLPQSPDYTVAFGAERDFDLPAGTLSLRLETVWTDRVYFTAFNRPELSQPSYTLVNAFVNIERDRWRATLYGKNLTDETIMASGQVATSFVGSPVVGFVQPPRTFGATLGVRF